jgi:CRISPR-associated protein Csx3
VRNCALPLTLIDIGGIVSPENRRICCHATHAIILAASTPEGQAAARDWLEFAADLKLEVLAIVESDYHGVADYVDDSATPLKGRVHRLERGEDVAGRPMVQAIARRLIVATGF